MVKLAGFDCRTGFFDVLSAGGAMGFYKTYFRDKDVLRC